MLCLQVFANKIALSEIRKTQLGGSIFCFRYLSHSFQISVSCISDICQLRFRYLSVAFQISVFSKLDVTTSFSLYYVGLLQLKEIY